MFCANRDMLNDALPPNYQMIIDFSLADLMERNSSCQNRVMDNNYFLLKVVFDYVERTLAEFDKAIKETVSEEIKQNVF